QLIEIDEKNELKILKHVNKKHVTLSHFSKMRVRPAAQLFSFNVSASLRAAVRLNLIDEEATTLAYFIETINRLFNILNSRTYLSSLNPKVSHSYNTKIQFLVFCKRLFLEISVKSNRPGWKPIQSGFRLAISSILKLQDD